MEGPYQPVPATLQALAAELEQATLRLMAGTTAARTGTPGHEEEEEKEEADEAWEEGGFRPEACLVNYYGEGDTLNGHRDDVEPDQSLPIISIRYSGYKRMRHDNLKHAKLTLPRTEQSYWLQPPLLSPSPLFFPRYAAATTTIVITTTTTTSALIIIIIITIIIIIIIIIITIIITAIANNSIIIIIIIITVNHTTAAYNMTSVSMTPTITTTAAGTHHEHRHRLCNHGHAPAVMPCLLHTGRICFCHRRLLLPLTSPAPPFSCSPHRQCGHNSLGCSAVFLVGGDTLDTPPTPVLLRGGDAVVLGAKARRCCHGEASPRLCGRGRATILPSLPSLGFSGLIGPCLCLS